MAKKRIEEYMVAEHVLEVRYAASGAFLNVMGYVADYIRDRGLFPYWRIDPNIVNFFDSEPLAIQKTGAFVAYNRSGYVVKDPDTRNFFQDKAVAFWDALLANKHFELPSPTRFGARTKIFLSSRKPFEEINQALCQKFFTDHGRQVLGGKEVDVTYMVQLAEGEFLSNVMVGPLHEREAERFLSFKSDRLSSTGLILDIDYFKNGDLKHKAIPELLRQAMALTWQKTERIADSIGL
jgi:hypothetical protein